MRPKSVFYFADAILPSLTGRKVTMRVLMANSVVTVGLLAMATPCMAASSDPSALSDAVLIDFTFTALAGVTPQYFGGDVEQCDTLGDAACHLVYDNAN